MKEGSEVKGSQMNEVREADVNKNEGEEHENKINSMGQCRKGKEKERVKNKYAQKKIWKNVGRGE